MLSAGAWKANQQNTILLVLIDSVGVEVAGLGTAFVLELSKAGAAFAASAGTKFEIGSGWYGYTATAAEADTFGPVAIKVTHASVVQQNLEYVVEQRTILAVEFTYTVTSTADASPIDGAYVAIAVNLSGANVVWTGYTDAFGVARDNDGNLPRLDPGTYYIFRQKSGFTFSDPDTEVVA